MAAPGVLANDTDADGDSLQALVVAGPAHGTLTLNANGSFTYTPLLGYSGTDQFTYRDYDGTTTGNTAIVTLTVNPLAATEGKITGDGSIGRGVRTFHMEVQTHSHDGSVSLQGSLSYQDRQQGLTLQSTAITFLHVDSDGIHATFSGTATVNGVGGYTFTVVVADNGEPGRGQDTFRIAIFGPSGFAYDSSNFPPLDGLLDSGNIQVHKP
jgi:VCBS repeat-containing protein